MRPHTRSRSHARAAPAIATLLAGAMLLAGALAPLAGARADSPGRIGAPIPVEAFAADAPADSMP